MLRTPPPSPSPGGGGRKGYKTKKNMRVISPHHPPFHLRAASSPLRPSALVSVRQRVPPDSAQSPPGDPANHSADAQHHSVRNRLEPNVRELATGHRRLQPRRGEPRSDLRIQ